MFGLSMAEVAVVAIVALVFLGPDKLPAVMKGLVKVLRHLGKLRAEFSKAIDDGLGPELKSLKPEMEKLGQMRVDFKKPISQLVADKAKEAVMGPASGSNLIKPAIATNGLSRPKCSIQSPDPASSLNKPESLSNSLTGPPGPILAQNPGSRLAEPENALAEPHSPAANADTQLESAVLAASTPEKTLSVQAASSEKASEVR